MKRIFLLLPLIGALISCQNDVLESIEDLPMDDKISLSLDELTSIAHDNSRTLTEAEVLNIVNDFSSSLNNVSRGVEAVSASIDGIYYIGGTLNSSSRSTVSDSIPVYRVELKVGEQKGYAIVSADTRSASVLAYVNNGDFENNDSTGAAMMLKLAEVTTICEINRVEELKATLRDKTLSKIASYLGKESVIYDEVKDIIKVADDFDNGKLSRSPAYDEPLTTVLSYKGPVTKTKWSQDQPYNLYLPVCYNPSWRFKTNYPAGCGIIAGAQALAAVANNITVDGVYIDWSYLTTNPTVEYSAFNGSGDQKAIKMVATLVKNMYEETNSFPNIDLDFKHAWYEDSSIPAVGSSSTGSLDLMKYLQKYVHCGTYYSQYAPDPLLTTLNVNDVTPCVAIMGGTHAATETAEKGSHAWVIDGYAICQKKTREILKNYDLYFHANMGWGGTDDGWYKVNADTSTDFETALGNYNLNFWEITEIRKN